MVGGDPLLAGHIDLAVVLIVLLKVVLVFAFLLVATMLMIWFERKVVSDLQNRIGPNTAGPFGVLQTLADGIKFFFKEDLIPDRAERRVFILAPLLTVVPAFLLFSIVPFGGDFSNGNNGTVELFGHTSSPTRPSASCSRSPCPRWRSTA
jgi:NADH-quinone oxidoreductase subunit H